MVAQKEAQMVAQKAGRTEALKVVQMVAQKEGRLEALMGARKEVQKVGRMVSSPLALILLFLPQNL